MLAERLISVGARIINTNTDGIFYLIDKNRLKDDEKVCKEWETITKLNLEADYFEAMFQFAINDYLAIKEGYSKTHDPSLLKTKGLFIDQVKLGKGMAATIIPEAIIKRLADNIPVEETIRNCQDIHKFLTYQKVSKDYSVEYNRKLIQRINRYYVSTDGPWLYKCKIIPGGETVSQTLIEYKGIRKLVDSGELGPGGEYWYNPDVKIISENCSTRIKERRTNYIKLLTDSGVTILNKIEPNMPLPKNINYHYYIAAAQKIVNCFKQKQLTLF